MKRIAIAILTCAFAAASLATTVEPASASTQMTFSSITAGYDHTCALTSSGAAYCWGGNVNGQLGNGTTSASPSLAPVAVTGGHTFTSIAANGNFTCAIDGSHVAYCWGENSSGQIGDGSYTLQSSPTPVGGSHLFTSLSLSDQSTACGITTANDSYCWGNDYYGGYGDGTQNSTSTPQLTLGSHLWASISAGEQGTCGVTTTNVGYCWGTGAIGHLGVGNTSDHYTPTLITAAAIVGQKSQPAISSTCGLDTSGAAWCWGGNGPALGDASVTFNSNDPIAVAGGHTFTTIAADGSATCAATSSGITYCWGYNSNGTLGDGTTQDRDTPTLVAGSLSFSQISVSYHFACGLTTVGIAWCWGNNANGQLGDGTTTERDSPVSTYYIESDQTISAIVDPSFSFTVANKSSACNGESNFVGTAGTATAVALGHLAASSNVSGGQTLTISSNAANGFAVYVRGTQSTQNLRSGSYNWTDVAGTYASPAALGTNERFGYTYKDSTASSSVSNPSNATFAKVDNATTNKVMGSTSSQSGSACVSFDAQTTATTPAGSYSAVMIYTALPTF